MAELTPIVLTITPLGAGTAAAAVSIQYTEGDADTTITGTVMMFEGTADVTRVPSATYPLPTSVIAALPAGTNNIGDVDVLTLPALAAGTNVIGISPSPLETSTIYSGSTALTPKFVSIVASASGDTAVVAAVSAKKIRVLRLTVISSGTVNVKFRSGTTDISGLHYLVANGGWADAFCPVGIFETAVNTALNINLSAAVAVGGSLTYCEV